MELKAIVATCQPILKKCRQKGHYYYSTAFLQFKDLKGLVASPSEFNSNHVLGQTSYLTNLYCSNLASTSLMKPPTRNASSHEEGEVVRLPNGIRVVLDHIKGLFPAISFYFNTGSAYEMPGEEGSTYLLEKLALKANNEFKEEEIHKKLTNLGGGNLEVKSSRDYLFLTALLLPSQMDTLFELVRSIFLKPNITQERIHELEHVLRFELLTMKDNSKNLINELLAVKMFGGRGHGSSNILLGPCVPNLESPQTAVAHDEWNLTVDGVQSYRKRMIRPENLIISAAGMSMKELLSYVEKYFGAWKGEPIQKLAFIPPWMPVPLPSGNVSSQSAFPYSPYIGGPLYLEDPVIFGQSLGHNEYQDHMHLALGLPSVPEWHSDVFPSALALILLGGGSSFSAGGPGKGLYTRMYTRVLSDANVESAITTQMQSVNAGGFGVVASVAPKYMTQATRLFVKELLRVSETYHSSHPGLWKKLLMKGSVLEREKFDSTVELERAKNQLKSNMLMSLESRLVLLENNARNVALLGRFVPREEILQEVENLEWKHLHEFRDKLFALGNTNDPAGPEHLKKGIQPVPTFVAVGRDLSKAPTYSEVLQIIEEEKFKLSHSS